MNTTLSFLFGREIAYRMALLEQGLLAISCRHSTYFAAIPSKLIVATGEAQPASLVEFVQPHWHAGQPSLAISPDLPPAIVAECLACVEQVMATTVPPRPARKWMPLFRANRIKVPQMA